MASPITERERSPEYGGAISAQLRRGLLGVATLPVVEPYRDSLRSRSDSWRVCTDPLTGTRLVSALPTLRVESPADATSRQRQASSAVIEQERSRAHGEPVVSRAGVRGEGGEGGRAAGHLCGVASPPPVGGGADAGGVGRPSRA